MVGLADIWQKRQSSEVGRWVGQPAGHGPPVEGKRGAKGHPMSPYPAPICSAFSDQDPGGDMSCMKSTLGRDAGRQTSLLIDAAYQCLHINDLCLQLDDQDGFESGMPGKNVDNAALAVEAV
jgi:hypothetical protein